MPVVNDVINVAELGYSGTGALGTTHTHTVQFYDVKPGDSILVAALAPSKPTAAPDEGIPVSCVDSAGNSYGAVASFNFQASPTVTNEGFFMQVFRCIPSTGTLLAGVGTITVTWDNAVFDRSIFATLIRHDGGSQFPQFLGDVGQSDNAIFASNQVTMQSPAATPRRSQGLMYAWVVAAKAGGLGGFGGVGGFTGYFQAKFHTFAGSKQTYLFNTQTHGADVILRVDNAGNPGESDAGYLPGGVLVPAFNGVGQFYSSGANAWKGIVLWLAD